MVAPVNYIKEEIVLNFEKYTLVKIETDKGTFQSSLRGHGHSNDKLTRTANSILQHLTKH